MDDLNKVMVTGRLGGDPELRYTANGTAMATFSLAVSRVTPGDNGDRKESTDWLRVVVWGKPAESVAEALQKGQRAFVEGRISARSYEDKDGKRRTTTELVALSVLSLSGSTAGSAQITSDDGEK